MSVTAITNTPIIRLSTAGAESAASAGGRSRAAVDGKLVRSFAMELAGGAAAQRPQKSKDPFVQLEAVFLRSFVEDMMPDEAAGMFGMGLAGEYWRSMLAEQMANAMAAQGRTGIAETLRFGLQTSQKMRG